MVNQKPQGYWLPLIAIGTRAHFYKIHPFPWIKIEHVLSGYLVILNQNSYSFKQIHSAQLSTVCIFWHFYVIRISTFLYWYCKHTKCCSCPYRKLLTFCASNGTEKNRGALLSYILITDSSTFQTLTVHSLCTANIICSQVCRKHLRSGRTSVKAIEPHGQTVVYLLAFVVTNSKPFKKIGFNVGKC